MRFLPLVSFVLGALSTQAFADDMPPPPPPPDPAPAPEPMPPPPPPGPPTAPPPGGGYMPAYQPQPSQSLHRTMTFEANLGIGWLHLQANGDSDTSDLGIGGLSLGVGGWLNPQLAITGRVAGATLSEDGATLSNIFFGPSLQYWLNDNAWIGGGAGLSILRAAFEGSSDSTTGFGLDLRAGYTFNQGTENTFNISLELNPGFYSENGESATMTGIGILFGYQHL